MVTIAGVGIREGIPAKEADAGWPLGILRWNKTGELLINDYHMHIVWRIDHDGILHRFAGTGVPGYSGDGGPAIDAQFRSPHDIAQDKHGNIVINDISNFVYRRIDAETGIIETIIGSGKKGRGGHGGPATEAEMDTHCGVAIAENGDILYPASGPTTSAASTPTPASSTSSRDMRPDTTRRRWATASRTSGLA